jgi:UDP-glucuronate decarboxylase
MKNVLVTGAAGFLGSHLAKHHLDAGDRVWGVDNFCSSNESSQHHEDLLAHHNYMFLDGDIADVTPVWHKHFPIPRFDLIYNFACPASPPRYQELPLVTMKTCVMGTMNVLDLAERCGAVVVHASTSEVYGDPDCSPQPETYRGLVNSYGPRACYDEGKRAAEALCFDYRNMYGLDARLVRIFNTYGPNMDPYDGRVVSNFVRQALLFEKLTVYGDGKQSRSFCYVDDLIRGIVALGALPTNLGTPINLGNPIEFTVIELASRVLQKVYGNSVRPRFGPNDPNMINHKPLPIDDPTQRRPDISRAKELLGWEPMIHLSEGLDKTIEYFRKVIANERDRRTPAQSA